MPRGRHNLALEVELGGLRKDIYVEPYMKKPGCGPKGLGRPCNPGEPLDSLGERGSQSPDRTLGGFVGLSALPPGHQIKKTVEFFFFFFKGTYPDLPTPPKGRC